jgi:hypothetical protein
MHGKSINIVVKNQGERLLFGMAVPESSTVEQVINLLGKPEKRGTIVRGGKPIPTTSETIIQDLDNLTLNGVKKYPLNR